MKHSDTKMNSEGFTLIEVIVALAVLTIGVLAVNAMQTASVRGNATSQRLTLATTWGQDITERIISLPYEEFNEAGSPYTMAYFAANWKDDDADGAVDNAEEGADPEGYQIRWDVTDDNPINNAKRVDVTVDYASPGGARSINFTCVKLSKT